MPIQCGMWSNRLAFSGAEVVKLSFGAYGERRDRDWDGPVTTADSTAIGNTIRHGFTGHEHLDSVGLIHMTKMEDPFLNCRRQARRARATDGPA